MIRAKINIAIFLILLLVYSNSNSQTIIVNKSNPIESISKGKLRNIFLGNSTVWNNGTLIQIADYNANNKLRNKFSQEIIKRTARKVSMIWIKVSLSGKSIPPKIFKDSSDIIEFVEKNEGAIAYIEKNITITDKVKILAIE